MSAMLRWLLAFVIIAHEGLASSAARADAPLPNSVTLLPAAKDAADKACGIRADYEFSGSILRVEVGGRRAASGVNVFMRVYAPSSVGPGLRDIWLQTSSFFTLGQFHPARENNQGILESSGDLATASGSKVIRELADSDAEISLIFDGVMPAARVAVGLPRPLPDDIVATLNDCASAFEKAG